jgi:chorismate dehydratase
MPPIRLGCVQYLNTLPLIEGLSCWKDAELAAAVPSRLIGMLHAGEVDLALASIVDAVDPRIVALPVGMIGCDGPTLTVRLFARVPIAAITSVGVDTDSHTSAILMQVLLARRFNIRPRLIDFDARERVFSGAREPAGPDAVLLIGDKVVTDAPSTTDFPHQLDLGQAWNDLTGLPFVYAVWMCRAGEEYSDRVQAAAAALDRQRRHNATRLDWVVARRAEERRWPPDLAAEYIGRLLKYEVGDREREAVELFVKWAHELGLCAGGPITWAEVGAAPAAHPG